MIESNIHTKINQRELIISKDAIDARGREMASIGDVGHLPNHQTMEYINTNPMYLILTIDGNQNSLIIKELSLVNLPHLKQLNISYNHIQSIQPISTMCMPLLWKLSIYENQIISIKPLVKMLCKPLNTLQIYRNFIVDGDHLNLLKLGEVYQITIDSVKDCHCGDLRWLVKAQMRWFRKLYMNSVRRITQEKTILALERKYPNNVQIYARYK